MASDNNNTRRGWAATLALGGALMASMPAQAGDVGVSIGISQPGVYGRIDIGRFPQPQVVVQQPVVIYHQARAPEPVYMWVPPGHRQNWRRHCRSYNACNTPVYFVQERWYHEHVQHPAPRYGERDDRRDDRHDGRHGNGHGKGHGDGKGHGKGRGHD